MMPMTSFMTSFSTNLLMWNSDLHHPLLSDIDIYNAVIYEEDGELIFDCIINIKIAQGRYNNGWWRSDFHMRRLVEKLVINEVIGIID